jgi:5-methylcytosine-specific restriction endonuclease McrA
MRPSVPDGDLAAVIEAVVTEKLQRLEARRFAQAKAPRTTLATVDTSPSSRHIPAAVRRAVYERDQGRCTFVNARGDRCPERHRLEFHHAGTPFGRGGSHSVSNLRLACASHNRYFAEIEYGREVMDRHRRGDVPKAASQILGP